MQPVRGRQALKPPKPVRFLIVIDGLRDAGLVGDVNDRHDFAQQGGIVAGRLMQRQSVMPARITCAHELRTRHRKFFSPARIGPAGLRSRRRSRCYRPGRRRVSRKQT